MDRDYSARPLDSGAEVLKSVFLGGQSKHSNLVRPDHQSDRIMKHISASPWQV
jgi:hypothetical protein